MNPGLAVVMLCAGAASAKSGAPEPALATTSAIEGLILGLVHRDHYPYAIGQMDLYIDNADLEGPLRMSIWPAIPGQKDLSVEIVDMARPAWDVAYELAQAGVDYEDVPAKLETVTIAVDAGQCPRLTEAVASLRGAFIQAVGRFVASPPTDILLNGHLHQRRVEVRMVGPDFESVSMTRQYPGPTALMPPADAVAQIAASCAGKPVRRMVFDDAPAPKSN